MSKQQRKPDALERGFESYLRMQKLDHLCGIERMQLREAFFSGGCLMYTLIIASTLNEKDLSL